MHIHSDQGKTFESEIFQEICKIFGIIKTRTTPYRPQSDGMIERANRTIENMLSLFVHENQKNWDELIPLLMLAYRSSVHETTGVSPHEMMFARPASLPVDIVLGKPEPTIQQTDIEYINNLQNKMNIIHDFARRKMQINSKKTLRDYSAKIQHNTYKEGDPVWVYYPHPKPGLSRKLFRNWSGPYVISKKINDVLYRVKRSPRHKGDVIHHNRLKLYVGVNKPTWH
jgi:hypothetical protein